ncbi:dephospho-CoA kinase [Caldisericum exile]|uniref:Dephospho-CoA kinase n=1 Tax=Caldisericum exile (strain DSM 21853 / NBRC 104410 / AZM16c01) TaxID=511051 RepID=A0A7U6GET2_CALEA|nr:dephospho-CoA kinase [Caldisericum exile]BAL81041.1 dephospho-CoA kinase [Caldisericum exile AZM16c01]
MKVIGLTGNIASGKSSVSKILRDLGAKIIDMDSIAKEIQNTNYKGVVDKIRETFGVSVFQNGKQLDRRALGNIVFSDKKMLEKLNNIMIPVMTERLLEELEKAKNENVDVVVVDAAILIEANWDRFTDEVWVVYTPKELQVKRLIERENIDKELALERVNSQMRIEEKMKRANVIIDNSGDFEDLKQKVLELWRKMKSST